MEKENILKTNGKKSVCGFLSAKYKATLCLNTAIQRFIISVHHQKASFIEH